MKDKKSPEYIAVSLMFYSFIVAMIVFAVFRFCGIAWFSQDYKLIEIDSTLHNLINFIFKVFEGTFIMLILTKLKTRYCLLISILYSILLLLIQQPTIEFCLDVIYIVSVPFIFNKDKNNSIIKSTIYIALISLYQIMMSFARYSIDLSGKYDLCYTLLGVIDYQLFIVVIYLYKIIRNKRRT